MIHDTELYVITGNQKRRAKKCVCGFCSKEFLAAMIFKGRFCSYECMRAFNKRKHEANRITCICRLCQKEFTRSKSKTKNAKTGLQFCSRKCVDQARKIGSGIVEIKPDHYTENGALDFHVDTFKNQKLNCGCMDCGEKRYYLLSVHHIDGNRSNNIESNFELLCYNCHIKRHLQFKNNKWSVNFKVLTDRNVLPTL